MTFISKKLSAKEKLQKELDGCIQKGRWEKAIPVLEKLVQLEPENPLLFLRIGDYRTKIGAREEACQAYSQAARIFTETGFGVKALAAYKMVLRLDPHNETARQAMQALHQAGSMAPSPVVAQDAVPAEGTEMNVIPLFASLTQEEFNEVVEKMSFPHTFPAGAKILHEGDTGRSLYIISKGAVRVVTTFKEREVELGVLHESDFFGEVAFLTGKPRTASVVASVETEVLEVKERALEEIVQKHPRVRDVLEQFYKIRVQKTVEKIRDTYHAPQS